MTTTSKHLIFAGVALLATACVKTDADLYAVSDGAEITITAAREGAEPDTRTVRKSDGYVEWSPMDEISVFYGEGEFSNGGSKFTAQNTSQVAIAEFRGRLDGVIAGGDDFTDGKYLYGVYPYSTSNSFNNGVVTISLPSNQRGAEGTFANGLFPTVARAKGVNLAFYNICGGIKFTVSRDDITSVSFKGNNGERLAGTAKVVFGDDEKPALLSDNGDGRSEITVYAPGGGAFEVGTEYFVVAYPTELASGYTMTFRTTDMKEGSYVSNGDVEIKRSIFGSISDADSKITAWSDVVADGGGEESGIYLGVMGFNEDIYSYPVGMLAEDSKPGFEKFIDNLTMEKGTVLYYSVDAALNTLQSVPLPADISTAAIVTFTDGLDQGSHGKNSAYEYDDVYLDALHDRIKNEKVGGNQSILAYSIGIRGNDVQDVTKFRNNLKKLASSDENATEVTSMSEVNAKFKEIAEQLSQSNYIQTINLTIPIHQNGARVRFTFDNAGSAEKSKLYIEGIFNLSERSLENVTYYGLECTSGTEIKGAVEGIFVTFTFEGVHADDNQLIESKNTDEWLYVSSTGSWQINSEFDKNENSDIVTSRSSAVIMLVLDCSSSLGADFGTAQTNAKDFINTLYKAVNGSDEPNAPSYGGDSFIEDYADLDMKMIFVEGGSFEMGATSEQGDDYYSDERPVHTVTVDSFYIGECEVTQAQWYKVMGTTVQEQASKAGYSSTYGVGDNYPMYYVNYTEALEFCEKLSALTGRTYTLPTEAQWEYAARGGRYNDGTKYSGSDNIDDVAWYWGNSSDAYSTQPVKQKQPNGLGLYDMSGNVCEWCWDWYGSSYYSSSPATNPTGPSSGSNRVLRGGGWSYDAYYCRVSLRSSINPGARYNDIGFRVVVLPLSLGRMDFRIKQTII